MANPIIEVDINAVWLASQLEHVVGRVNVSSDIMRYVEVKRAIFMGDKMNKCPAVNCKKKTVHEPSRKTLA